MKLLQQMLCEGTDYVFFVKNSQHSSKSISSSFEVYAPFFCQEGKPKKAGLKNLA